MHLVPRADAFYLLIEHILLISVCHCRWLGKTNRRWSTTGSSRISWKYSASSSWWAAAAAAPINARGTHCTVCISYICFRHNLIADLFLTRKCIGSLFFCTKFWSRCVCLCLPCVSVWGLDVGLYKSVRISLTQLISFCNLYTILLNLIPQAQMLRPLYEPSIQRNFPRKLKDKWHNFVQRLCGKLMVFALLTMRQLQLNMLRGTTVMQITWLIVEQRSR